MSWSLVDLERTEKNMSMPKGAKIKRGYSTVADDDEAMDFRAISKEMTERGWKMNHSSARNYLIRAMRRFARVMLEYAGEDPDDEKKLDMLAKDPQFHDYVREQISDCVANGERELEENGIESSGK